MGMGARCLMAGFQARVRSGKIRDSGCLHELNLEIRGNFAAQSMRRLTTMEYAGRLRIFRPESAPLKYT